ncbi:hypothetical protein Tco_1476925 [Tanacetum coccineum]
MDHHRGVDGPPVMLEDPYAYVVAAFQAVVAAFQALPSPDYVPGPKYPPLPEFVMELVYPDFMPPEDEILPAEEQPLPASILPTANSPGYVPESDLEEDPDEDDDKDPEEDPADGGDDGNDEDESSDDDEDEDVDIEGDEEEEEHLAPADSTAVALPAVDQALSAKETEPFETNESVATPSPHPVYRVTARISIRDETPISLTPREEVERLLAMPTPPSSPLSPWSSPLPQIPSPPLPVSSPVHVSNAPLSRILPLLPILLPTSSPPLHLLSTNRRADRPEVTLPPRKRLGIALGPRYEVGEISSAPTARPPGGIRADYGFVAVPPSPDYVLGPEYPPSPDFIPESVYPEFMPPEDEVLPAEEQPLPAAVLPTADSPGYVPKSDPEEDQEVDDDEDPEEDLADFPVDGGDNGDDEDESSDDDEDEDVDIKGDEEEEEHPAPADSTVVALPAVDQAPSAEETEPFETDESTTTPPPHPAYRVIARISIRDEPPTPFWSDTKVSRLLAIPTPPPSPLSPWSSPLPQIPSPPLPLRAEAPSTSHSLPLPPPIILSHTRSDAPSSGIPPLLPIPLPTSSPPLHLLSTDRRADRPKVTLLPRKRLGIALCPRYEVGESSSTPTARPPRGIRADYGFVATMDRDIMRDLERDVGYGITDTWDEMLVDMPGAPTTNDTELGRWMTEDRRAHARTAKLMEAEARMSREAWGRSIDASGLARVEVMSLRTQVVAHQARLQTQMTEFERQQGPAKGPTQPDAPEEAGSSS